MSDYEDEFETTERQSMAPSKDDYSSGFSSIGSTPPSPQKNNRVGDSPSRQRVDYYAAEMEQKDSKKPLTSTVDTNGALSGASNVDNDEYGEDEFEEESPKMPIGPSVQPNHTNEQQLPKSETTPNALPKDEGYEDDDFIRDDDGGESQNDFQGEVTANPQSSLKADGIVKANDDDPFDRLEKEYYESKQNLHRQNRPMSAARGGSASRPTTAPAHRPPMVHVDEASFAIPEGASSITASPHALHSSIVGTETTPKTSPHQTPILGSSRLPLAPRSHSAANSYQQASPRKSDEPDLLLGPSVTPTAETLITSSNVEDKDLNASVAASNQSITPVAEPSIQVTREAPLIDLPSSANADEQRAATNKLMDEQPIQSLVNGKGSIASSAPAVPSKKPFAQTSAKHESQILTNRSVKSTTPPPPARRPPSSSGSTASLHKKESDNLTSKATSEKKRPATSLSAPPIKSNSVQTNNNKIRIVKAIAGKTHVSKKPQQPTPVSRGLSEPKVQKSDSSVTSPITTPPPVSSVLSDQTRLDKQLVFRFQQLLADLKMNSEVDEKESVQDGKKGLTLLSYLKREAEMFYAKVDEYQRLCEEADKEDTNVSSDSEMDSSSSSQKPTKPSNTAVRALALHELTKQQASVHVTPSPTLDGEIKAQIESLSEDLKQLKTHTCAVVEAIIKREDQVDNITLLSEKYEQHPRYFNVAYSESLVSNHLDNIREASEEVIAKLDKWKEVFHHFDVKYKDELDDVPANNGKGGLPPRLRPFPFLEYPNYISKMQQDLVFLYATALGPFILIEVENNVLLANRKRNLIDRERLRSQQQAQVERLKENNSITSHFNVSSEGTSSKPFMNNFSQMFGGRLATPTYKVASSTAAITSPPSNTATPNPPPLMGLTSATTEGGAGGTTPNNTSINANSQTVVAGMPYATAHLGFFGDFNGRIPVLSNLTPDMQSKYSITSKEELSQQGVPSSQQQIAEALFGRETVARRNQSPSRFDPKRAGNQQPPLDKSASSQPFAKPEPVLPRAISPTQLREHYFFARLSAPSGTSVVRREAGNLGGEGQHLEDMKLVAEVERPSNSWFRGLTAMIVPMKNNSKSNSTYSSQMGGQSMVSTRLGSAIRKSETPEPRGSSNLSKSETSAMGFSRQGGQQRPHSAFALQASRQRSALRERLRSIHNGVLEGKVPAYHSSIVDNSSYNATPYRDRTPTSPYIDSSLPPPNPNNSTMLKPDNTSFLTMDKQRRMAYLRPDDRYTSVLSMRRVAKEGNAPKYDSNGRRILGGGGHWKRNNGGDSLDDIRIEEGDDEDEDEVSKVPPPVGSRPGSAAAHYAAAALRHRKSSDGSTNSRTTIGQRKNLPRHVVATTNRDLLRDMRRYEDSHHFWADFVFTIAMCKFWGRKLRKRGRDGRYAIKIQRWWRDILTRERFFVLIEEAFIHSFRPRRERAALWLVDDGNTIKNQSNTVGYEVAVPPTDTVGSATYPAGAILTLLTYNPEGDIVGEEKIDNDSNRYTKASRQTKRAQKKPLLPPKNGLNSSTNELMSVESEGEDDTNQCEPQKQTRNGSSATLALSDSRLNVRNPSKLEDQFAATMSAIVDQNHEGAEDDDAQHDEDYTSEESNEDLDDQPESNNSPFNRTQNSSSGPLAALALHTSHSDAANTVEELLIATRMDKLREQETAKALLSPRSAKRAALEAEATQKKLEEEKKAKKLAKMERRERRRAKRMGLDVEAQSELHQGMQGMNSADKLLASATFHFGNKNDTLNPVEGLDASLKELVQPRKLAALGPPVEKGNKWIHEFLYDVVVRQMQYEDSLREEERTSIRWQNYRVAKGKAERGWVVVTCVTLKPIVTEAKVSNHEVDDQLITLSQESPSSLIAATQAVERDTYPDDFDMEQPPVLTIEQPTMANIQQPNDGNLDLDGNHAGYDPTANVISAIEIINEDPQKAAHYHTGMVLSRTQHMRDIEEGDYHLFPLNVLAQLQLQAQQEEARQLRQQQREVRKLQKLKEKEELNRSVVARFLAGASGSGNRPLSALEMMRKRNSASQLQDGNNDHPEIQTLKTSEASTTRPPSHHLHPDGSLSSEDESSSTIHGDQLETVPKIACHILVTTRKSVYPFIAPKATRRHPFRDNIIATYYHYIACANVIKRSIRHYMCRKQMPHNIAACKAMVRIQRFYHHLFNSRRLRRELEVRIAARKIFVGYQYWNRRRAAIKVGRDVRASNVIRHAWLCYAAKRDLKRLKLERDSATIIQRRLRGMLGRAKAIKAKQCQTILRFVWVRLVTRPLTTRKLLEKAAVTAIQRQFRAFASKCAIERKKAQVATALNEHLLNNRQKVQNNAVQQISAAYKGYATRRDLEVIFESITKGQEMPVLPFYRWGHIRAVQSFLETLASKDHILHSKVSLSFSTDSVPFTDLRVCQGEIGIAIDKQANYFSVPRLIAPLKQLSILHLRRRVEKEYETPLCSSHTGASTSIYDASGERILIYTATTVPNTFASSEEYGSPIPIDVEILPGNPPVEVAALNPDCNVHRPLIVRIQCFLRKSMAHRKLLQLREDKRRRQRYFALWCVNARYAHVFGQECARKACGMWKLALWRSQARKQVAEERGRRSKELALQRQNEAALAIQQNWRRPSVTRICRSIAAALNERMIESLQYQQQQESAIVLQTALMNYWNRQKWRRTMMVRQRTAADKLTKWWRLLLGERQLCEARYEHLKLQEKAALEIQLFWAACKARKAAQLRKQAREIKYPQVTAVLRSKTQSRSNSPAAPVRNYVVTSGSLPLRQSDKKLTQLNR